MNVQKVVYKALLKGARQLERVPPLRALLPLGLGRLGQGETEAIKLLCERATNPSDESSAPSEVIKHCFRSSGHQGLDAAFAALRQVTFAEWVERELHMESVMPELRQSKQATIPYRHHYGSARRLDGSLNEALALYEAAVERLEVGDIDDEYSEVQSLLEASLATRETADALTVHAKECTASFAQKADELERAMELDPDLCDARAAFAELLWRRDGDRGNAVVTTQRAKRCARANSPGIAHEEEAKIMEGSGDLCEAARESLCGLYFGPFQPRLRQVATSSIAFTFSSSISALSEPDKWPLAPERV